MLERSSYIHGLLRVMVHRHRQGCPGVSRNEALFDTLSTIIDINKRTGYFRRSLLRFGIYNALFNLIEVSANLEKDKCKQDIANECEK